MMPAKKITALDIAFFSRQMATMLASGIPLIQAFEIVANGRLTIGSTIGGTASFAAVGGDGVTGSGGLNNQSTGGAGDTGQSSRNSGATA